MALIPVYPAGHKRENTRKADKDWTEQEKLDFKHTLEREQSSREARARAVLAEIAESERTLGLR